MLVLAGFGPTRSTAQNEPFLESNGQVIIQAESVPLAGDWVFESSDPNYTGDGYIRWNGPDLFGSPGSGTLAYKVYITNPGEYNVRFRMSHLGAPAGDQWNDCWTRMDGGTWVKTLHPAGRKDEGFTFHSPTEPSGGVFSQMRYTLSAGEHTLFIAGRSSNLRLDRIHFYKDGTPNPLNLTLAESPRGTVDDGEDDGADNGDDGDTGDDNGEDNNTDVIVNGAFKKWHPVTVGFEGPEVSENDAVNPFLSYRLQVTFTQGDRSFTVPGYFAADGNAAESSAEAGNVWQAHFVPDSSGVWDYTISMRTGTNVAVDANPLAGTPMPQDGLEGSFVIADLTDPATAMDSTASPSRDHRTKGMLRYNGSHYLQFDNGEYFLKGGANSPENFLAYADFDSTYNAGGTDFVKTYADHVADWQPGDPVWQDDKGKGIIGALNYLGSKGMNVVYFLTMNVEGDGYDVWPWTTSTERLRYDVSKLDQWNLVFNHMDSLGMMLHVVLQETENELLLDGGTLGLTRKLYYRELMARFGHHHALTWNIGEENDENTDTQRKAFASYIRDLDPYDHPIVVHTFPGQYDDIYEPLLGFEDFNGPSLQINRIEEVHEETKLWRRLSAEAGQPWVVSLDEIGPYQTGVMEEGASSNFDEVRKEALWPHLMAGGAGVEWYFGYDSDNHDLSAETWRTRSTMWDYTHYALDFFQTWLPFHQMNPADSLTPGDDYVFADTGRVYAVYSPAGDSIHLDVATGQYTVQWYNPRMGGELFTTEQDSVTGPVRLAVSTPDAGEDWVLFVNRTDVPAPVPVDDGTPTITALLLLDADADSVVAPLTGQLLNLAELPPHLNVMAELRNTGEHEIAYIELHVTPPYVIRKETIAPYALFGDVAGNFVPGTFSTGENTVMAVPFYYQNGAVVEGNPLSITFDATGANPATNITVQAPAFEQAPTRDQLQVDNTDADNLLTFALEGNYPNPFNPTTVIAYTIPEAQAVRLTVYDMLGREVRVLVDGQVQAGQHEVRFDASSLPAGAYLYKLDAGEQTQTRKMLLVK